MLGAVYLFLELLKQKWSSQENTERLLFSQEKTEMEKWSIFMSSGIVLNWTVANIVNWKWVQELFQHFTLPLIYHYNRKNLMKSSLEKGC